MRPQIHELKSDSEPFQAVISGRKMHEIRYNDRDYRVGDELIIKETVHTGEEMRGPEPKPLEYTGNVAVRHVSHIQEGYGLQPGWVILSFAD